mgnify:CR=1 FL=1
MPLYEYQCQECSLRFERIEKASELKDGLCPECGAGAHRLIGAPALQFKGSGWYVNDYGKGNGNPTRATAKATEAANSAAENSTDSNPEKKTEKKAEARVACSRQPATRNSILDARCSKLDARCSMLDASNQKNSLVFLSRGGCDDRVSSIEYRTWRRIEDRVSRI